MMIALSNYKITDKIHESNRTVIYRGHRVSNDQPVVIKTHCADYPTPRQISRYRQDYELGHKVDGPGVIKYYALEKYKNGLALIQEDFGAVSLPQLTPVNGLDLSTFLDIAIQLAEALATIHHQNIIHKDIKPSNIVMNPDTKVVKVIDFGLASQLGQEMQQTVIPNRLEGTLAYISPEQTGRMNRVIDYRTDFYSLGVTFYQLLCGHLPFEATEAMELVHSHIARIPSPPHQVKPGIPHTLSKIVVKLLAKNSEDRYQSSYGLKADLLRCRTALEARGEIVPFILGQQDVSSRFQIPQKLYGREQEIAILLAAFERVSAGEHRRAGEQGSIPHPKSEILLVAGYSGVGKSALVREAHRPITETRGYFISGKYDRLQRTTPYAAISQAFNAFCHQLLTESPETLAGWQQKIAAAVGHNGQVLLEVIPNLELVIGQQPPVVQVGPKEAQNRFNLVFQNFLKAISQREHPLVMFLDDLQWADPASLNLLKTLMTADEIQYSLIIGAYRDNEVDAAHPLMMTLAAMAKEGAVINTLELQNLSREDVKALLADTLRTSKDIQALSDLVYEKTHGNAFFTIEFLKSLYEETLLTFHQVERGGSWVWDVEQIRTKNITDNVVELMAGKIGKLRAETQTILKFAACMGNQFDLNILAIIYDGDKRQTATVAGTSPLPTTSAALPVLWPAIEEGFVIALDDNYKSLLAAEESREDIACKFKFSHDRIQQAAYSLIEEAERETVHLQIGRLLLADIQTAEALKTFAVSAQLEEHIFDIINQFNQASKLITDEAEKIKVAALNLQAGQKAKQATAYRAAVTYLKMGTDLLPEGMWQSYYQLMFQLNKALAEAEYLATHFEAAQKLYPLLLQKARSDTDKLDVYFIQIEQLRVQGKYLEALEVGKLGLKLLGVELPDTEAEIQRLFEAELQALPEYLGERQIADLVHAPAMTDEKQQRLMKLLPSIVSSAYMSSQHAVTTWASVKITNISLQYGHTDVSAYAYVVYGANVARSILQDYEIAYQFGKMATELSNNFDNLSLRGRTYHIFANGINHWKKHLSSGTAYFRNAYHFCVEGGDLVYAGFAISMQIIHQLIYGRNLVKVNEEAQRFLPFLKRTNVVLLEGETKPGALQPLANLLGLTYSPTTFDNKKFEEQQFLQATKEVPTYQAHFYCAKIRSLYWFGFYKASLQLLDKVEFIATRLRGEVVVPEAYFFMSLTLTTVYGEASEADRATYDKILDEYQAQMKIWAEHCSDNYLHKYLLVEAERARLAGRFTAAMTLYKQGITSASKYDYINNEALGNELYARFWLENDEEDFAKIYMTRAHALYRQWGATAKVVDLEEKYPQLLPQMSTAVGINSDQTPAMTTTSSSRTTSGKSGLLDLSTIIKASQAIFSEIDLDKLLSKLMRIVIENAGAQQGYLILDTNGQLFIEAAGTVDETDVAVRQSLPIEHSDQLSEAIVRYVFRTGETLVLHNATQEGLFTEDTYVSQQQAKSILCMPLLYQGQLSGVLYLENNLTTGAFTEERLEVLNILLSQAAISLKNASLYDNLRNSEARLRSLVEYAPDFILTADCDGKILFINRPLPHRTVEQMIGDSIYNYVTPEYHDRVRQAIEYVFSTGGTDQYESSLPLENGERLWFASRVSPIKVNHEVIAATIITTDITERKRAEEALRESEERYRGLFEGVPVGLYRTTPAGQILDANPAMVQMLGALDRESVLAIDAVDLYVNPESRKQWQDAMEQEAIVHNFETRFRQRDGTIIWVRDSGRAVRDDEGRVLSYEGSLEDITERRRLEEQLRQAQKMEAIGRLAGGVAHDFNNLLTAIMGYTGLVLETLSPNDPIRPDIEGIQRTAERATSLTRQLLAFARKQVIHPTVLNLNDLILNVDKMLRRLIGEDIELVTLPAPNLGQVKADPGQLEQVLLNLAVNARDAMPRGGKLTIETSNVTLDEGFASQHVEVTAGDYVLLAVSDTGIGMTEEVKAHLFEPFFTTKERGKGTGLGLATCFGIVKQSGGHIEAYSEVNQGTTFKIYLPRLEEAISPVPGQARSDDLPRGAETVLLVEDESAVRELASRMLRKQGYNVLEAANGDEALRVAGEYAGEEIHLLLTDVVMPRLGGKELADRLKVMRPDIKVLFTSGYTDNAIVHPSVLESGMAFLPKPFSSQMLARKVREVLDG